MNLFESEDYRQYLRAYLKALPRHGRGELTKIALHLGVNTTLLSQVLAGTRELTLDQAYQLSGYLGHTELEQDFFFLQIQIERAAGHKLKKHLTQKKENLKREALKLVKRVRTDKTLQEGERAVFYSSWIYSAVHVFTSVDTNGKTLEEISKFFNLSRSRALEVMQFLTETGLCVESQLGLYRVGTQSTFVEKGSPHLLKHLANWRIRAIQKSENLPEDELMFTAQLSLSKKDFAEVRESIAQFIKQLSDRVQVSEPEELVSLNIDWLRISN